VFGHTVTLGWVDRYRNPGSLKKVVQLEHRLLAWLLGNGGLPSQQLGEARSRNPNSLTWSNTLQPLRSDTHFGIDLYRYRRICSMDIWQKPREEQVVTGLKLTQYSAR